MEESPRIIYLNGWKEGLYIGKHIRFVEGNAIKEFIEPYRDRQVQADIYLLCKAHNITWVYLTDFLNNKGTYILTDDKYDTIGISKMKRPRPFFQIGTIQRVLKARDNISDKYEKGTYVYNKSTDVDRVAESSIGENAMEMEDIVVETLRHNFPTWKIQHRLEANLQVHQPKNAC